MVFHFLKSSYSKLKNALSQTRSFFGRQLLSLFHQEMNSETFEKIEQLLYEADFGVKLSLKLTKILKEEHRAKGNQPADFYLQLLKSELKKILVKKNEDEIDKSSPQVVLVVGVNGNGKTTTIAKIANLYKLQNQKVLVGAADTFRAAAVEQLQTWAERIGVDIVKGKTGGDPSAVAFDAITAAKSRGFDYVFIDTAGRLHNKLPLMQELQKIRKVCQKAAGKAPDETLLVLDATTGQNAIEQAKEFHKFTPISAIVLTKLDGTAKGGIVAAIQDELGIEVKFIGTGEKLEDLEKFEADEFIESLFETQA